MVLLVLLPPTCLHACSDVQVLQLFASEGAGGGALDRKGHPLQLLACKVGSVFYSLLSRRAGVRPSWQVGEVLEQAIKVGKRATEAATLLSAAGGARQGWQQRRTSTSGEPTCLRIDAHNGAALAKGNPKVPGCTADSSLRRCGRLEATAWALLIKMLIIWRKGLGHPESDQTSTQLLDSPLAAKPGASKCNTSTSVQAGPAAAALPAHDTAQHTRPPLLNPKAHQLTVVNGQAIGHVLVLAGKTAHSAGQQAAILAAPWDTLWVAVRRGMW